ncbi:hypothetical protein [Zooshikella sp. RANM57]|uniref:hypothetical protein n=1 Tax=Zooshikella sp. RANM57 TaxID=3425863 RepID=UPI003D6F696C
MLTKSWKLIRRVFGVSSVIFIMLPHIAKAQDMNNEVGLFFNQATYQCMLTQQAIKDYMLLGVEVDVAQTSVEMDESIKAFENMLKDFKKKELSETLKSAMKKLEQDWQLTKPFLTKKATKYGGEQLLVRNVELYKSCSQFVETVAQGISSRHKNMLMATAKQRILAQQMVLYYTAYTWGFRDPQIEDALSKFNKEFHVGVILLGKNNTNVADINNATKKIKSHWIYAKTGMSKYHEKQFVPHLVASSMGSIVRELNKIVSLYQDLIDRKV